MTCRPLIARLGVVLLPLLLIACADPSPEDPLQENPAIGSDEGRLVGALLTRGGELPVGAFARVALVDTADGSAVAAQSFEIAYAERQPFELTWAAGEPDPLATYRLEARVVNEDDETLLTSLGTYPVSMQDPPDAVSVELHAAEGQLLGAGAAAPVDPEGARQTVEVTCDDGFTATVETFAQSARVATADSTFTLPQAIAASGAKYQGGGMEVWLREDRALITTPTMNAVECEVSEA